MQALLGIVLGLPTAVLKHHVHDRQMVVQVRVRLPVHVHVDVRVRVPDLAPPPVAAAVGLGWELPKANLR